MNHLCYLVVCAVLWAIPWVAAADDLEDIRNQIQNLQKDYEKRIRALEDRLEKAEAEASDARLQAEAAEVIVSEAALAPATSTAQER